MSEINAQANLDSLEVALNNVRVGLRQMSVSPAVIENVLSEFKVLRIGLKIQAEQETAPIVGSNEAVFHVASSQARVLVVDVWAAAENNAWLVESVYNDDDEGRVTVTFAPMPVAEAVE